LRHLSRLVIKVEQEQLLKHDTTFGISLLATGFRALFASTGFLGAESRAFSSASRWALSDNGAPSAMSVDGSKVDETPCNFCYNCHHQTPRKQQPKNPSRKIDHPLLKRP
jgi:hypothetical protein